MLTRVVFPALTLALVASVAALQVGSITPGPGLPSLESLGLTNEDLIDPDFAAKHNITTTPGGVKARQAQTYCTSGPPSSWANIYACQNYLASLGTQNCVAPRGSVIMCVGQGYADTPGAIYGTAECHDTDSSYCRDVAYAVGEIINNCYFQTIDTGTGTAYYWVMGATAAGGNGCLQVNANGICPDGNPQCFGV